jgi:hypothetical protein
VLLWRSELLQSSRHGVPVIDLRSRSRDP